MTDIVTPNCPLCGLEPYDHLLDNLAPMAFCANDNCRVFSWDMRDSAEQFHANAVLIVLNASHSDAPVAQPADAPALEALEQRGFETRRGHTPEEGNP